VSERKDRRRFDRSQALAAYAQRFIPGITQTASKRPEAFAPGQFPDFIDRAEGAHVWDVDGNEYIDFVMACGPVTLGYCYPAIDQAIREQLAKGIIFSRPTALEGRVAEMVVDMVPCAEMARFFKGGAEANSAALRLARAFTGREKVATCGYRGWHDQWAVTHTPRGIPRGLADLTLEWKYNDLHSLEELFEKFPQQIAAVVLDPVSGEAPAEGFLAGVKELAHQHGTLLIFDEIVTGFRLAPGGAQEYYGVVPDLAVFAKGIANGMPLAAVAGRHDVMSMATQVFMTLTYGDEQLSLAAARATLTVLRENDVCGYIWQVGSRLAKGVQKAIADTRVPFALRGIGAMPAFVATYQFAGDRLTEDDQNRAWFYLLAELAQRGILWRRQSAILPSYSHTDDDVARAIQASQEVFRDLHGLLAAGTLREAVPLTDLPIWFKRL
jgi:glutamate-1-semialdehyde aminotransferase